MDVDIEETSETSPEGKRIDVTDEPVRFFWVPESGHEGYPGDEKRLA